MYAFYVELFIGFLLKDFGKNCVNNYVSRVLNVPHDDFVSYNFITTLRLLKHCLVTKFIAKKVKLIIPFWITFCFEKYIYPYFHCLGSVFESLIYQLQLNCSFAFTDFQFISSIFNIHSNCLVTNAKPTKSADTKKFNQHKANKKLLLMQHVFYTNH